MLQNLQFVGIAFSGAVGIGLYQTSGEVIALGGPGGAFIAFAFAGLVVVSVMRCLAELVSVRPVKGPLIDFADEYVDEALGFTVGVSYWYGYSNSSALKVYALLRSVTGLNYSHLCKALSRAGLSKTLEWFSHDGRVPV